MLSVDSCDMYRCWRGSSRKTMVAKTPRKANIAITGRAATHNQSLFAQAEVGAPRGSQGCFVQHERLVPRAAQVPDALDEIARFRGPQPASLRGVSLKNVRQQRFGHRHPRRLGVSPEDV